MDAAAELNALNAEYVATLDEVRREYDGLPMDYAQRLMQRTGTTHITEAFYVEAKQRTLRRLRASQAAAMDAR